MIVPGFGGAEFLFQPVINCGAKLFGFQRVPCIARLKEYGRSVWYENKPSITLASLNEKDLIPVAQDMTKLLSMPCEILPNYLCVALTPSNPVLHTSRLYSMFQKIKPLKENILFYASWNDAASEILFSLDEEVQKICRALPEVDLNSVISLKKHYESETPAALTKKLQSISSLSKVYSPMIKTAEGYLPDFENRYFKCDFDYGLDILLQFAEILKLEVPNMKKVMQWYKVQTCEFEHKVNLQNCGLNSKEDILDFYQVERS